MIDRGKMILSCHRGKMTNSLKHKFKIMKRVNAILVLGILIVGFASCRKDGGLCRKGNGEIVSDSRSVSGFSNIDQQTAANVIISQSDEYSVTVEASDNLQEIIETKVRGDLLIIDTKNGKCISGHEEITVYVTLPDLRRAIVSGSGDMRISGTLNVDKLDLVISGSGNIENSGDLNVDNLDIDISGSGNVDIFDANIDQYDIDISGSGDIDLSGESTAGEGEINISGSGDIDLLNYVTSGLSIRISGSGNIFTHVIDYLSVNISGSGNVNYKGYPTISTSVSGSGEVVDIN